MIKLVVFDLDGDRRSNIGGAVADGHRNDDVELALDVAVGAMIHALSQDNVIFAGRAVDGDGDHRALARRAGQRVISVA